MLFGLPLIGLGFLASVGGLRFTIYAVPILAFGMAFLITELTRVVTDKKLIKYLSYIVLTAAILYPNYKHIEGYKVPTVFNSDEVKVLDSLKGIASREDYVVAWWDYGYPIRYFADVKTLSDGAKHDGRVNFPVSYILTSTQEQAAKMARLDVEYTESKKVTRGSNIEQMTVDYGFNDTNDMLLSLQTDIELPNKTRDIYFYLPFKMLTIYPTVKVFSNINLMDGSQRKAPFFFTSNSAKETQNGIDFGRGVSLNKKDNTIMIGKEKVPLRRIVKTFYTKDMKLKKHIQPLEFSAPISLIFMSNYNTFVLVDEETYNSLYVQLMVLEEYDRTLFEKVILSPQTKVYKLKI